MIRKHIVVISMLLFIVFLSFLAIKKQFRLWEELDHIREVEASIQTNPLEKVYSGTIRDYYNYTHIITVLKIKGDPIKHEQDMLCVISEKYSMYGFSCNWIE